MTDASSEPSPDRNRPDGDNTDESTLDDDHTLAAVRAWIFKSDLRLVLVLSAGMYLLFTWLSLMAGFRGGGLLNRLQTITFFATLFAMLALALNLQWGYAGLANLGIAGFMAVGVYSMALVSMPVDGSPSGLGLPLPIGIIFGVLMATLVGAVAALPALRLRADYLAIVTLAFGEIIRRVVRSRQLESFTIGGQELGLGGVSGPSLPPDPVQWALYSDPAGRADPTAIGSVVFSIGEALGVRSTVMAGIIYALLLVVATVGFYWLLVRVGNSPFGRVLKAIREDELAASALGKDVRLFKIKAFALGCGLMGLAAMLWFMERGSVSPDTLEPELTFFIFVALILGGSGSNTGAVVGGIVFGSLLWRGPGFLQRIIDANFDRPSRPDTFFEAFRSLDGFVGYFFSDVNITALQFVILGVILMYLMQRRPDGLLGHRTEIAASIDLSVRETDTAARDGREENR